MVKASWDAPSPTVANFHKEKEITHMDGWGIGIFLVASVLYGLTKKKAFLFLAGIGGGILVGAIWSYLIVMSILP